MKLFNIFKKKKPEQVQPIPDEEPVFEVMTPDDKKKYIEAQADTIIECNNFIKGAKQEYGIIGSYFADIQTIEALPVQQRKQISDIAKQISDLSVDRRIFMSEESKVSMARYRQMSRDEDEMVDAIKKMQNDEAYLQVVKRDRSALEGEKMSLRMAAKELTHRQYSIRKITLAAAIVFAILFVIIIVMGFYAQKADTFLFLVVLFLATVFLAIVVMAYTSTIREIRLTERKLNKAVILLNKVKIKLFNTTNLLDYQYAKYEVQSSYELSEQYQLYLEAKKVKEKYNNATLELTELEDSLMGILHSYALYDADRWLAQPGALHDPKEMVELRHEYSQRRQLLREQIKDAQKKAEDAVDVLNDIEENYPELSGNVQDAKRKVAVK